MEMLEVRELRYFVAVAEELHFGRAATRLHIAQPAVSKTVQRVEARLGVRLFDRNSRGVLLTPAGHVLLEHGKNVLDAMSFVVQHVQRAGESAENGSVVSAPSTPLQQLPENTRPRVFTEVWAAPSTSSAY